MKPEMTPTPDKATFRCPKCKADLHAPLPAMDIANGPHVSMIVAVHQADATCISCPLCDAYLIPAMMSAQVQWAWVPGERPTRIIKPQLVV